MVIVAITVRHMDRSEPHRFWEFSKNEPIEELEPRLYIVTPALTAQPSSRPLSVVGMTDF